MLAKPRPPEAEIEALAEAASLDALYGNSTPERIIERSLRDQFMGEIAAVSSFGADSAVLLNMIANIDRHLPVIFLDTGKHFEETFSYRDALVADFGLTNVRVIDPDAAALELHDPDGTLHLSNTDACCEIRKVEPLALSIEPFRAWFTGRKRFQAATRATLPSFESVGDRIRINPLARWTTADQADYMRKHVLRENPLVAYGYLSIGCFPCTQPVLAGNDARSGRWAGQAKVECGIHLSGRDRSLTDASL